MLYGNRSKTTLPFQKRFYEKKKEKEKEKEGKKGFLGNKMIYSSLLKEKEKEKEKRKNLKYITALRFCTNYTVYHVVVQARGVENWLFICPLQ